jgi:large-conductance mechanosensitive channel
MTFLIQSLVIAFFLFLALFAFNENNRQKKQFKLRNKPKFTPMKLNEEKINDHSK